jgi:hypothetical protein
MSTIRILHKNKFTTLSNKLAQNNALSLRARGLMLYLLSLPDDWKVHVNHLVKIMLEGRDAILSSLKELKQAGYVYHVRFDFKGGWTYFVFEEPTSEEEFKLFLRTNGLSNSRETQQLANQQLQKNKEENTKEEKNTNVAKQPKAISFKENKFIGITEAKIEEWKKAFPGIDIHQEIEKATKWVIAKPTQNKHRKKWEDLLVKEWFQRALENFNYKKDMKDQGNNCSEIYDILKPIYDRYCEWYNRLNDSSLLDKGFLVLTKTQFYDKKNSKFKYNLNFNKFMELMKDTYCVPEYVLNEKKD